MTNLRLVLLDKEGETVTQDIRELTVDSHNSSHEAYSNNRRPLLRSGVFKLSESNGFAYADYKKLSGKEKYERFNGLIAPFFFTPSRYNSQLFCSTKRIVEFRLKVTEEELQRFDAAKVEISFSE
jgi:hypothetical protein